MVYVSGNVRPLIRCLNIILTQRLTANITLANMAVPMTEQKKRDRYVIGSNLFVIHTGPDPFSTLGT